MDAVFVGIGVIFFCHVHPLLAAPSPTLEPTPLPTELPNASHRLDSNILYAIIAGIVCGVVLTFCLIYSCIRKSAENLAGQHGHKEHTTGILDQKPTDLYGSSVRLGSSSQSKSHTQYEIMTNNFEEDEDDLFSASNSKQYTLETIGERGPGEQGPIRELSLGTITREALAKHNKETLTGTLPPSPPRRAVAWEPVYSDKYKRAGWRHTGTGAVTYVKPTSGVILQTRIAP